MHDTPLTMHHTSATGNELYPHKCKHISDVSSRFSRLGRQFLRRCRTVLSSIWAHQRDSLLKTDFVTGTGQARGYKQKNKQTWKRRETQTSLPLERHQGNEASWGQQSLTSPTLTASETAQQLINKVGSSFTAFDVIRLAMAFFTVCSG